VTSYCACSGASNVSSEAAVAAAASAAAAEYAAAHTPGAVASTNSTTAPSSTGNAPCAFFVSQNQRTESRALISRGCMLHDVMSACVANLCKHAAGCRFP